MTRNLNNIDRAVRGALGVVLVVAALWAGLSTLAGIVLLVLALVMVVTATIAFCPLYLALGVSTHPRPHRTRRTRRTRRPHVGAPQRS